MADRYQGRTFPGGDDYGRNDDAHASSKAESDPLAELARLIGQTDPFGTGTMQRANLPLQPHARSVDRTPSYDNPSHDNPSYDNPAYDNYDEPLAEPEYTPPPSAPSWMQHAARHEPPPVEPQDDYPSDVHPLHRYAPQPQAEPNYDPDHLFADQSQQQPDLSRYDDALYGGYDSGQQQHARQDHAYDDYAYEEEQQYDEPEPRRRGGMVTVVAVLALAVFGVGGAFAYRTYTGGARGGEPPIIRADAGPTKIVPAPSDNSSKVPDRMATGDGSEKLVPREEAPVDVNARSGPRVVFPPLTPNGSVAMPSTIVPGAAPPPAPTANGTLPNNEPHRIKTFSVRGDQGDTGAPASAASSPAAPKPAAAPRAATTPAQRAPATTSPAAANANAPLSLAPQASAAPEPPTRVANNGPAPAQIAPATPSASGASYLVSVTSQPSEAEAQASYRALQGKYPSVLGGQSATVARASSKSGGTTYRAGPAFATSTEASQFCKSYQGAGGQCWVVKN